MADSRVPDGLRAEIRRLVGEVAPANPESITPEMSLRGDFDLESIDLIELGVAIEDAFDIELLKNPMAHDLVTLGDLEAAVAAIVAEREK